MRKLVLLLLALGAAGALAAGIVIRIRQREAAARPSSRRPPPEVLAATPYRCDVDVDLDFPVDVEPVLEATLASKEAGYLSRVLADRGDRVHAGELLATVEPADLADVADQAAAEVTEVRAQVDLARQNAARAKSLYQRQMISQADYDQAVEQLASATAALEAAVQTAGAAGLRVDETHLTAPFDGWVIDRLADPGALLSGQPASSGILTVAKLDPVRVFLHVSQEDVPRVELGQRVTLRVDGLAGVFTGTVQRISPALDLATRTETVEVRIPNPPGPGGEPVLRAGMFGRADLTVGRLAGALVVPAGAVLLDGPEHWVYVVRGAPGAQTARRADVQVAFDGGNDLAVTGLAASDEVIVRGVDLVGDRSPIRAVVQPLDAPDLCVPPTSAPASIPAPQALAVTKR